MIFNLLIKLVHNLVLVRLFTQVFIVSLPDDVTFSANKILLIGFVFF